MILLEQTAIGPAPGYAVTTLTAGTGREYSTRPSETPPNVAYLPLLTTAFAYTRSCWSLSSTTGGMTISQGRFEFANGDGVLDPWMQLAIDGQPFVLRRGSQAVGDTGAYPADYPVLFSGLGASWTPSWGTLVLNTTDALGLVLDTPCQAPPNLYAGTNIGAAGVEGLTTDIYNNPKPFLLGFAQNFQPILVNSIALIYQVGDGSEILPMTLTVYVGGLSAATGATSFSSLAKLQAATIVTSGAVNDSSILNTSYGTYAGPDGWYFRMGFTAGNQITCDAAEGTAAQRTTAQCVTRLLSGRGKIPLANIEGATALDAVLPGEVGVWTGQQTTIGAVLNRLLGGANGFATDTALGKIQLGTLLDPETQTSVATFQEWQIFGYANGLNLSLSQDQGVGLRVGTVGLDGHVTDASYTNQGSCAGLPVKLVLLDYAPNYTIQNQTSVPALAASNPTRAAMLFQSCATVSYADPTGSIQKMHAKAPEFAVQSVFRYQADALAEATRQFAMRGRMNVIVQAPLSPDDAMAVDLGKTFTVQIPRFGWNNGRKLFCIGIIYSGGTVTSGETMTLIGWGKL